MKLSFTLLIFILTHSLLGQQIQTGLYCQEKCSGVTPFWIKFENDNSFEIRFYNPKTKNNVVKVGLGFFSIERNSLKLNFSDPKPNSGISIEKIGQSSSDSIEIEFVLYDNIINKKQDECITVIDNSDKKILNVGSTADLTKIPKRDSCMNLTINTVEHKDFNLTLCDLYRYRVSTEIEFSYFFELFNSSDNMLFEIRSVKTNKFVLYSKELKRSITYIR